MGEFEGMADGDDGVAVAHEAAAGADVGGLFGAWMAVGVDVLTGSHGAILRG